MTHLKRLLGIYAALIFGALVASVYENIQYGASAVAPRAWVNEHVPALGSEAAIVVIGLVLLAWLIAMLITLYRVMAIGPILFLAFAVFEIISLAVFATPEHDQIAAQLTYLYILVQGAMIYFLFFGAGKELFESKASPAT